MKQTKNILSTAASIALLVTNASAQFNWGTPGGSGSGSSSFNKNVVKNETVELGEIPVGIQGVKIKLECPSDVDVELWDKATGKQIIGWDKGGVSSGTPVSVPHQGMSIAYSGYNGVAGQLGHETIEIASATTATLVMKVYGFQAGDAVVTYSWTGGGSGGGAGGGGANSFTATVPVNQRILLGDIPKGVKGIKIQLDASADLDVELFDKATQQQIIGWPNGKLSSSSPSSVQHQGMNILYSGFGGIGGKSGNESIEIPAEVTADLEMKVFGFEAGTATVSYSWTGSNGAPSNGAGGQGSFEQYVPQGTEATVGPIPSGLSDVSVSLSSSNDIDILVYSASGVKVVNWQGGLLSSSGQSSISFAGTTVTYSGFNGDGTGYGNEFVRFTGTLTEPLVLKVLGYQAGMATVNYSWGGGSGGNPPPDELGADYSPGNDLSILGADNGQGIFLAKFADVPSNHSAYNAVHALWSSGVVQGHQVNGVRNYYPNREASQAEVLAILLKCADYNATTEKVAAASSWTQAIFEMADARGLDRRSGDSQASVYRGDAFAWAAALFYNYYGNDPFTYLLNRDIVSKDERWSYISRGEIAIIASKAALATGKKLPYGLVTAAPANIGSGDVPNSSVDSDFDIVAKSKKHIGSKASGAAIWADGKYSYCARFVRIMFNKHAKFADAYTMGAHFDNRGVLRTTGTPTAGAVLFYKKSVGNGYYGHTSIATGTGKEIGATGKNEGVTEKTATKVGVFWGWVTADEFRQNY